MVPNDADEMSKLVCSFRIRVYIFYQTYLSQYLGFSISAVTSKMQDMYYIFSDVVCDENFSNCVLWLNVALLSDIVETRRHLIPQIFCFIVIFIIL